MNEIQLQLYTYNNNFFSHEGRAPHLFFFGFFFFFFFFLIGFIFGLDYLLSVVREIMGILFTHVVWFTKEINCCPSLVGVGDLGIWAW